MPTRSGGTTGCDGPRWTSSHFDDSYVRDLQTQLAETGRRLWVLDVTSDLGVPTYVAILHWMQNGQENIEFGSGAHFDPRIAMLRTLTELNQFLSIGLMGGGSGEKPSLDGITPLRLEDYPFLAPSGTGSAKRRLDGSGFSTIRASRSTPASKSPGEPASISWCSIRRGPTSRCRSSG